MARDKGMKATEVSFSPGADGDGFPGTEGRILLTIAVLGSLEAYGSQQQWEY